MEPLRELRDAILRHTGPAPLATSQNDLLGVRFVVARYAQEPTHHVYEPVFSLVVQGEKRAVLGGKLFTCRVGHFLVASVDLPLTIHISVATPEQPFVALAMRLRPAAVAALLLETAAAEQAPVEAAGLGLSDAPAELLEAVLRHVRLLDRPRDLPVLGPLAEREILWRLLSSEQGHRVRQIGLADSRLSQIGRAMRWMRDNYGEGLRVEDRLARVSAMSVTSFHRHFRAVALMSPLQYLQQIRLQEARARLLAGAEDVATVGHAVGYDSPSQFSREYKRAYGAPPGRDARLLRASNGTRAPGGRRRTGAGRAARSAVLGCRRVRCRSSAPARDLEGAPPGSGATPSCSCVAALEARVSMARTCPMKLEERGGLLGGLADGGDVEVPADDLRDVADRHALVGHPVIPGSRGALLERQPEEAGRIELVHRGPAVPSVTHVRREAVLTRDGDETRDEAVIAVAMYRRREAHHRRAHALCSDRERRLLPRFCGGRRG